MLSVDINCDMGEGFDLDAELMLFISSANIACGYHAGDEDIMRRTVELALQHNVSVGAHPSYPDKINFGRIDMEFDLHVLQQIITDQICLLQKICFEFGVPVHHVKPHGALYNRAAWDEAVALCICNAIKEANPSLKLLYGLSGSKMKVAADAADLKFIHEVFADRIYKDDASLTPRTEPNSLIEDIDQATGQVLQMVKQGVVTAASGNEVPIVAETICIHGDGKYALQFAGNIYEALKAKGIHISAA